MLLRFCGTGSAAGDGGCTGARGLLPRDWGGLLPGACLHLANFSAWFQNELCGLLQVCVPQWGVGFNCSQGRQ